jgi:hypothetical protein
MSRKPNHPLRALTQEERACKQWESSHGWRSEVEQAILDGMGSVDVVLEKHDHRIACELSVTSRPEDELGNVEKCLAAGFDEVVVVASEEKRLSKLEKYLAKHLDDDQKYKVHLFKPDALFAFLGKHSANVATTQEVVGGYNVEVRYRTESQEDQATRKQAISDVILKALKRMKGKK